MNPHLFIHPNLAWSPSRDTTAVKDLLGVEELRNNLMWTAPATPNLFFELLSPQYYTLSDGVNQPEDSKQLFVETGENMRLIFHPCNISRHFFTSRYCQLGRSP